MALMVGVMPHDVIAAANREWLPDLAQDLARHADGTPTRAFEEARQALEENEAVQTEEAASDNLSGVDDSDILAGTDDAASEGHGTDSLILGGGADGGAELASEDLLLAPAGADDALAARQIPTMTFLQTKARWLKTILP